MGGWGGSLGVKGTCGARNRSKVTGPQVQGWADRALDSRERGAAARTGRRWWETREPFPGVSASRRGRAQENRVLGWKGEHVCWGRGTRGTEGRLVTETPRQVRGARGRA